MQYPSKSGDSDPITRSLLKETLDASLDLITAIVDMSMADGIFLEKLKDALVKPLLEKVNLEPINKNYRSVSNLAFL